MKVIWQRALFVDWYDSLTNIDQSRLVWFDEHGVNMWTVRRRGRSLKGDRVDIPAPTYKGTNCTVLQATSASFGKLCMQAVFDSADADIFKKFIEGLLKEWHSSKKIPSEIRCLGPIILLDNATPHTSALSQKSFPTTFEYHLLPPNSPFMNAAEPVNRAHKMLLRKYHRRQLHEFKAIDSAKWGTKMASRFKIFEDAIYAAWKDLPDEYPNHFLKHLEEDYFPRVRACEEIHG